MTRTTYYIEVRVYRNDHHYRTVGLKLDALDIAQAAQFATVWGLGASAVAPVSSIIQNISSTPHPDRGYYSIWDWPAINEELQKFWMELHNDPA